MTAKHKVPRSTVHLVAMRCWQAAGVRSPRYVYLTDKDVECARQSTEYMVAYTEPVEGKGGDEHFIPVAKFPISGISGDISTYKAIILTKLNDAWQLAKARGLVP